MVELLEKLKVYIIYYCNGYKHVICLEFKDYEHFRRAGPEKDDANNKKYLMMFNKEETLWVITPRIDDFSVIRLQEFYESLIKNNGVYNSLIIDGNNNNNNNNNNNHLKNLLTLALNRST